MSTFEQDIGAGESIIFPGAEQFHLLEADDPIDITFYSSRSQPLETWEDMKGGFRIVFKEGFIQVKVESATAQTVKIGLTSGRGEYDRSQGSVDVTSGEIDVTNIVKDSSWYCDTLQKRAFLAADNLAAALTNYSHVELWNPAASGVNLIITNIETFLDTTAKTTLHLRTHNASLANAGSCTSNKYINEAAPSGLLRNQHNLTQLGTLFYFKTRKTEPGDYKNQFIITGPILIPQGVGLMLVPGTVNVQINASFEWIEVTA